MMLTQVAFQKIGFKPEHGADMIISNAAKAKKLPIGELEGFEFQLKLFDDMPEKQQVAFLGETIDNIDKMDELLVPMKEAWASGNSEALAKLMNDGMDSDPALFEMLLTKRNAAWAEWIDNRLDKPGTVFMAVGAGHLAGKDSVQDLLVKRGIKSVRVKQ
jgi:hypothetical protein